jgi:hypothetical protein
VGREVSTGGSGAAAGGGSRAAHCLLARRRLPAALPTRAICTAA